MTCQLGLGSRHSVFTDILLQVGNIYKEGRVRKSVGRYIGRRLFGDFIIALDPCVGSCNVQRYSYHARTQKMRFYPKSVKTMVASPISEFFWWLSCTLYHVNYISTVEFV
jgi:hypothetical protein